MKATECLNAEHGVFLTQLEKLETMMRAGASADEARAAALVIATAVERHRDVEEELLYPAILRAYGEGFAPIQVMEAEHQEITRCIRGIDARDKDAPALCRVLIDVLRDHIDKEIKVLFPMAEQAIPAEELEQMARRCAARSEGASGHSCGCPGHG